MTRFMLGFFLGGTLGFLVAALVAFRKPSYQRKDDTPCQSKN